MIETWRWFGPLDKITLMEIAQTGTSGIVTALHEIPYGEIWPVRQIVERQKMIAKSKMFEWMVVESLPVDERIKIGEVFTDKNIATKRPGTGISPMKWDEILGSIAGENYYENDLIQ